MIEHGENISQKSKERIDPNFDQLPGVILPVDIQIEFYSQSPDDSKSYKYLC